MRWGQALINHSRPAKASNASTSIKQDGGRDVLLYSSGLILRLLLSKMASAAYSISICILEISAKKRSCGRPRSLLQRVWEGIRPPLVKEWFFVLFYCNGSGCFHQGHWEEKKVGLKMAVDWGQDLLIGVDFAKVPKFSRDGRLFFKKML